MENTDHMPIGMFITVTEVILPKPITICPHDLDTLAGSGPLLLDHPADPPQQLTLLLPEVESNTSVLVLENYYGEHNCIEYNSNPCYLALVKALVGVFSLHFLAKVL